MLASQKDIVEFLRVPDAYPGTCSDVQIVETHAALIFLAGEDAYKIKKSVVYPYLDFSTLEKREAACRRELEINQPHAPQIYLDVIPVSRSADGTLALGGKGTPVEWAVHMRRFDDDALLARRVETDGIKPEFVNDLADEITRYHAAAVKTIDHTGADRIAAIIDELDYAFASANGVIGPRQGACFNTEMKNQLEEVRHRLDVRSQLGYVRRVHGDLHLQNIVVLEDKPVLFDAIEFDEDFATIDVLYDLAFLVMDLEAHDLHQEANMVLNRYVAHDNDGANIAGLQAFPLFLSCRAGIRSMVALTRRSQSSSDTARALAKKEASDYFATALQFLERREPRLICIGGLSGTGKTTVARLLAPHYGNAPGALHLRSDVERKLMFGVAETDHLGASAYTSSVGDEVYGRVLHKAKLGLLAGRAVILDAVFSDAAERDHAETIAKAAGLEFDGLWLQASELSMMKRVKHRTNDASDADTRVVQKQLKMAIGQIGWHAINSDGALEATLDQCKAVLG